MTSKKVNKVQQKQQTKIKSKNQPTLAAFLNKDKIKSEENKEKEDQEEQIEIEIQQKSKKQQVKKPKKTKQLDEEDDESDEEFEIIKKKVKTQNKKTPQQEIKQKINNNNQNQQQEQEDLELAIQLSLSENQNQQQQQNNDNENDNNNIVQPRRSARTRGQRQRLVEQNIEIEDLIEPEQEQQININDLNDDDFEQYLNQNQQQQQRKKSEKKPVAGAIFDPDQIDIKDADTLNKQELKKRKMQRQLYIEKEFQRIRKEKFKLVEKQQEQYEKDLETYDSKHVIDKVLFDISQIRKNALIKANRICKFGVLKENPVQQKQRCTYWNTYDDLKTGCQVYTEPKNKQPYHNWLCFHCYKVYRQAEDDVKQLQIMFNKEKAKLIIGTMYLTNKNVSEEYKQQYNKPKYFRKEILQDMLQLFL